MFEQTVKENRIRRAVQRRGLRVSKSGRKDPKAIDFNGFTITDLLTN